MGEGEGEDGTIRTLSMVAWRERGTTNETTTTTAKADLATFPFFF